MALTLVGRTTFQQSMVSDATVCTHLEHPARTQHADRIVKKLCPACLGNAETKEAHVYHVEHARVVGEAVEAEVSGVARPTHKLNC